MKIQVLVYMAIAIAMYNFSSCKQIHLDIVNENRFQEDSIFFAGAAVANITPLSTDKNVHDSLFAKSVILDDGLNRLVFVIVDNQGLPSFVCSAAKEAINLSTGIPTSNILIASTHTHSGVIAGQEVHYYMRDEEDLFDDYQLMVVDQIAASVDEALDNLQPAKIGWSSINKPDHVFNRRWYMQNQVYSPLGILDSVKTNPGFVTTEKVGPAGPTDPEVSFIAIKSLSDDPIAILASYSLHYVGGMPGSDITAGYFAEFGNRLGTKLGADTLSTPFVGIMANGTSGDINNINYGAPNVTLPPYQKVEEVAEDIATGVAAEYANVTFNTWVPLKAMAMNIVLDKRTPSLEELNNKDSIEAHTGPNPLFHPQEKTYATRLNSFTNNYPDSIPVTLQAFAVGDLAIGAAPFEIFAETGLEFKSLNPLGDGFLIGIGNGHWGYLPTPSQHVKGGYETWITVNRVQKDASEIMIDELLTLFDAM